jgi:hypothetical protein
MASMPNACAQRGHSAMVVHSSNARALLCFAMAIGGLAGCNQSHGKYDATVQGAVTVDGELAHRGVVMFYPADKGPVAVGEIGKDGSYSLRIGQGNAANPDASKIPSGDYAVTVLVTGETEKGAAIAEGGPPPMGPRLTAAKYAAKSTTDLKFAVKPGSNMIPLTLEGASADAPPELPATEQEKSAEPQSPSETVAPKADAAPSTSTNPGESPK